MKMKRNRTTKLVLKKSKFFDKKIDEKVDTSSLFQLSDYFLSPSNAAQFLNVSVKMIYELIQSGELKSQPVGRRIKRIRKSELEKWLSFQVLKHER